MFAVNKSNVVVGVGFVQNRTGASTMVADVCSIYPARGGVHELFATQGLAANAVHNTRLGEGLVGLVAEEAQPLNLADAQHHEALRVQTRNRRRAV